jgi:large subunit ribosomal protein L10
MLSKTDKEEIVASLRTKIDKAQALFLTNFIGIESNEAVAIRKEIREANGTVVVTRNTLFRIAAKGTYAEELLKDLKGTNAVAFAFEDAPGVAKALLDANKANELVSLGAGFLDQKPLAATDVMALAKLPSRDEMLGTLLATFNAPVSAFARVMDAIREQKDSGVEAAPAAEVATEEVKTEEPTE